MFGRLLFTEGGRGKLREERLYGLTVLRAEVDPKGFWGERRLNRAGRLLGRGGALRVLAPADFGRWPLLASYGLRPVDPGPFLRAQSAPLALESLERRGLAPDRATVALRGLRADREMLRAAVELAPRVRRLVVDAPRGGAELAQWLRWELGVPILPREEEGQVALAFQPVERVESRTLSLCGPAPDLDGLVLTAPALGEGDRGDLHLLSALWEGGRLSGEDVKIT